MEINLDEDSIRFVHLMQKQIRLYTDLLGMGNFSFSVTFRLGDDWCISEFAFKGMHWRFSCSHGERYEVYVRDPASRTGETQKLAKRAEEHFVNVLRSKEFCNRIDTLS